MYKCSITLEKFRNFDYFNFRIPNEGTVLITGPNGSGKTSILEGIFFAIYGSSFRERDILNLINTDASYLRVKIEDRMQSFTVYLNRNKERNLQRGNNNIRRGDILKEFFAIYSMGRENLLDSTQSERREIIDRLARIYDHSHRKLLSDYVVLMKHKKEALILGDYRTLSALNAKMWELYLKIVANREDVVKSLSIISKSLGFEDILFIYKKSLENEDELNKMLKYEVKEQKVRTGLSFDELSIYMSGKDMRSFYSHGEKAFIWNLILFKYVESISSLNGKRIFLLLDEAFSVLDNERMYRLVEKVKPHRDGVIYVFTSQRPLIEGFYEVNLYDGRVKTNI